ncbi:hypothetical protein B0T10DRAFT_499489 [Thelonectria olida]|uniref:Zn(2)-C6 fungal-type domain-containing protein n=1 Tax=Thelonectria olida TaxID=1576542 RepID=A0A9P8VS05_9HYPO|nr:hypothetical protein B0T10DRAFT_499489 [Thelonectria olida]
MTPGTRQDSQSHRTQQHGYRGRVRSGCLTCRSRKVKCDEERPICNNCVRLKRACVYKPRQGQQRCLTALSPDRTALGASVQTPETGASVEATPDPQILLSLLSEDNPCLLTETFQLHSAANPPTQSTDTLFLSTPQETIDLVAGSPSHTPSLSTLISRDIELTTAMDTLEAYQVALQPSFSFFLEEVDSPLITPYDEVNWRYMKLDTVELGMSNTAIASSISALSALYRGQLYGLPLSTALSLYNTAKHGYYQLLEEETQDFGLILANTFLLCLFGVVHYETSPVLKEPSEAFTRRLAAWSKNEQQFSPLCLRISTWLRLLHVTTVRGGGTGLISDTIFSLLPDFTLGIVNLRFPSSQHSDASTHIHEVLSAPIFEFYYQLQGISGQIARLTHYHRSRTTGMDQEEVVQRIADMELQLHELWESRSATQRQTPEELRSCLAPQIANSIISLIGICTSAYHAEFIEMDRVLRDPVSETTRSTQARQRIRDIVDGDWNAYHGAKLNTGYLRPLFLCAIESMDREECQWAVKKLEQIKNPICRSDFFASFGKALSDAQLEKGRRVTSKYFCMWYFGINPPFL